MKQDSFDCRPCLPARLLWQRVVCYRLHAEILLRASVSADILGAVMLADDEQFNREKEMVIETIAGLVPQPDPSLNAPAAAAPAGGA